MDNINNIDGDIIMSRSKYYPSLLESVVTILIGIICSFQSEIVLGSIGIFIGIVLVLLGATYILSHYRMKKKNPQVRFFPPYNGYVSIIFGVILILFPAFFVSLFMFMLGALLLLLGGAQIYMISKSRKAGVVVNGSFYIIPIAIALLGIVIMVNPFAFANTVVVIIFGVSSLVYGATNLIRYFVLKRQNPTIKNDI